MILTALAHTESFANVVSCCSCCGGQREYPDAIASVTTKDRLEGTPICHFAESLRDTRSPPLLHEIARRLRDV